MTNTTATAQTYDAIMERARELGSEHGEGTAAWVEVGTHNAQLLLDGYENGDPEILDMPPAPLSGEYADSMTPDRLRAELDVPEETWENNDVSDSACTNYELSFSQSYWDEICRRARYQLD